MIRGGTKQPYGVRPSTASAADDGERIGARAPETSPCHALARQNDELDPVGNACKKATAAASRAARGVDDLPQTHRLS